MICVRYCFLAILVVITVAANAVSQSSEMADADASATPAQFYTRFRIGEKLTYSVAYENFQNIAYMETQVVSRGKLSGLDVVELKGKLKTFSIVSAAISMIDETRTVFATPDGHPVLIKRTFNDGPVPKELIIGNVSSPQTTLDLLTLIYKLRASGGNGSFSVTENGETTIFTATSGKSESVRIGAGTFETTISSVESPFLSALGIRSMSINFSSDENKLPVLIRFKTVQGDFRASLIGVQVAEIVNPAVPVLLITPALPELKPTPKPLPTPTPYIDNQPLLPELSFSLGESLEYVITTAGRPVAAIRLQAKERKLIQGRDTLRLTATVFAAEPRNEIFNLADSASGLVNPDTLTPYQADVNFGGNLRSINGSAVFDIATGQITLNQTIKIDAPAGTHGLLSLLYAMRSFNLKPSKDPTNPVNDTRVAVFYDDRPYIFTLRPSNPELITIGTDKIPAQMIAITTGNGQLDKLAIKVWLGVDDARLPLRISVGMYQADLVLPKLAAE